MEVCSTKTPPDVMILTGSIRPNVPDVNPMKDVSCTLGKNPPRKKVCPGASLLTHFVFLHKNCFCSGVIRECFSTSFKLGQRSQPVQVTPFCQLQRTQSDPSSSIRACICTEDFCNDEPADNNQIGNDPTGNNPNGTMKILTSFSKALFCHEIMYFISFHE